MQVDKGQAPRSVAWPPVAGSYIVGDPTSPVAICTLTSAQLLQPLASIPGVAIVGQLHTANVGIEHVVRNVITNPAIRYLLLCGKESRVFQPGQALRSLLDNGIDQTGAIVNALGYEPILRNLLPWQVDLFRRQVELIDQTEEQDSEVLNAQIKDLVEQSPGPFQEDQRVLSSYEQTGREQEQFLELRPGGRREPLSYDPKGYFVISLDRAEGLIIVHHYLPDHAPAHVMRGRTAESVLLGLLREGLISQLSHAGYLGAELAKAESALRLGLGIYYEQDRPLRRSTPPMPRTADERKPTNGGPAASQTWEQFAHLNALDPADVALEVTARSGEQCVEGIFLEPGVTDPVRTFRRTVHPVRVSWSSATQVVMGKPEHFVRGALLRAIGTLRSSGNLEAKQIAVISKVVNLLPDKE